MRRIYASLIKKPAEWNILNRRRCHHLFIVPCAPSPCKVYVSLKHKASIKGSISAEVSPGKQATVQTNEVSKSRWKRSPLSTVCFWLRVYQSSGNVKEEACKCSQSDWPCRWRLSPLLSHRLPGNIFPHVGSQQPLWAELNQTAWKKFKKAPRLASFSKWLVWQLIFGVFIGEVMVNYMFSHRYTHA